MKRIKHFGFWSATLMTAAVALTLNQSPGQTAGSTNPVVVVYDTNSPFRIPPTDDGLPGAGPIRRQPWFQKYWVERRTQFAKDAPHQHHALVFLGDSIIQQWGDDFEGMFAGNLVANRGISGDTTRGVLIRMGQDVLLLDPDGVVLLIGTNDLQENADPETIAANLKLIIAKLEAHNPYIRIILCQIFPSSETKKRPADKIKEINRLYAAAVKGDPQVTLIETWPLFADAHGNAKKEEFPDLLHPNKAGYTKWAAGLRPYLEMMGLIAATTDAFTPEPGWDYLFNGHDLTGWGYRPTTAAEMRARARWRARDTNAPPWPIVTNAVNFDGQITSGDDRFIVKYGRLVDTPAPEFRKEQRIDTVADYTGDFELKLEFRATPDADSGIYLRGPQLQIRDYTIAGPYTNLMHYKPQDWNELDITVKGPTAYCVCNDEVIEKAFKVPMTNGPIGLEGDRGQVEYRNIRMKKLE